MSVLGEAAQRNLRKKLKRWEGKARKYAHEVAAECAEAAWKAAGADSGETGKKLFEEHYERVFDEIYQAKLKKIMDDNGFDQS